jgi:hypothetical protein
MVEHSEDEPTTAGRIIDELLASGEPVDVGSFSIDVARAAEKLEAYQYADRSTYLVPIVEGLHRLGASYVVLRTKGADLEIEAGDVDLGDPAPMLAGLARRSLGRTSDASEAGVSRIAVGLDMVLGLEGVERVGVSYTGRDASFAGEYRVGQACELVRRHPGLNRELVFLIDRPWTAGVSLRGASHEELEHLRTALRFSPRPVSVDGEYLGGPAPAWDFSEQGQGPGFAWESGLLRAGEEPAQIELWTAGVCVERIEAPGFARRGVVRFDAPRWDLSGTKIVRDERFEAAMEALEGARERALEGLRLADAGWNIGTRPAHWSRSRVDLVLGRAERAALPLVTPKVAEQIRLSLSGYLIGVVAAAVGTAAIAFGKKPGLGGWGVFLLFSGMSAHEVATALAANRPPQKREDHVTTWVVGLVLAGAGVAVGLGLLGAWVLRGMIG